MDDPSSPVHFFPACGASVLYWAVESQKAAASVGFDWPRIDGVIDRLREEITELDNAIGLNAIEHAHAELGDVLFSVVNLARFLNADPETALRNATERFQQRFNALRSMAIRTGKPLEQCQLHEMDALWEKVKRERRASGIETH